MSTLASRCKELRAQRGLTQVELAALLGLAHQNISNLESGKIARAPRYINDLADILGVTVDYLTRGESHDYANASEIHEMLAIDRPMPTDPTRSCWVISVPAGTTPTLPKDAKIVGKVLKKFSDD